MVRVNKDNTVELDLENKRAPLIFVVAGRSEDNAEMMGRSVIVSPEDACALGINLTAVGEAELSRRDDEREVREGHV